MTEIIINPFEGIADIWDWAQHVHASGVSGGGDDYDVKISHTVLSAVSGTVTQAGGDEFNSIIIKIDGDPQGRSVRICENARVLVHVGQHVNVFDPIGADALNRGGIYRGNHINGMAANGTRIPFLPMVTMTQAQARAAIAPPAPNVRHTVVVGANVRSAPSLVAPKGIPLKGNIDVAMVGFAHGDNTSGTDVWFHHAAGWSHASGFTDQGTHDLANETPVVVVPPIVITPPPVIEVPPPVVVPPIVPPVVEPPVVTPPVVDVPPAVNVPPVVAPPTTPPVVVITPPPLVSKLTQPKAAGITLIAGVLAAIVAGVLHFIGLF